jgi:hypothetical protein
MKFTGIIVAVTIIAAVLVFLQLDLGQTVDLEESPAPQSEPIATADSEVAQADTTSTSPRNHASIWRETAEVANTPQIRGDVPDLSLYAFDRDTLTKARAGDKLSIQLPEPVAEAELWVESANLNTSGSITLAGKVDGYSDYSFVMTLGPKSTFATIGTAAGVFNLRGNLQHFWVGLGRSFNHHVDPTKPDFRIVLPRAEPKTASTEELKTNQGSGLESNPGQ